MMCLRKTFVLIAGAVAVTAQRPANVSICDWYTTALFQQNNYTNQQLLLTALVNTAVIGNFSHVGTGAPVPGILSESASYNNTAVKLLPYFNGVLLSSNLGGNSGASVNWLDDGGAVPLSMLRPANGTQSNQYRLMIHLYTYFAGLLGCSSFGTGNSSYVALGGDTSMYEVHKYMNLDAYQVGYFIQQVGLAAASFGVADVDVTAVAGSLEKAFGYRCAPSVAIPPAAPPELQSICIADSCPVAPNGSCSGYSNITEPKTANGTVPAGARPPNTPNGTGVTSGTSDSAGFALRRADGLISTLVAVGVILLWL